MKTEAATRAKLAELEARLEADDFDSDDEEKPDWVDTSNRITALQWVLELAASIETDSLILQQLLDTIADDKKSDKKNPPELQLPQQPDNGSTVGSRDQE